MTHPLKRIQKAWLPLCALRVVLTDVKFVWKNKDDDTLNTKMKQSTVTFLEKQNTNDLSKYIVQVILSEPYWGSQEMCLFKFRIAKY